MKRRILLVDDELTVRLTLKAVLEMNGFEVETAASAAQAMRKLKQRAYHLVITDMKMETEESGHEVIRMAQQQDYAPATAILTAFPVASAPGKGARAGSVLVKPIHTQDLLRQIEVLLIHHEDEKQGLQKLPARAPGRHGASRRA